MRHDDSLSRFLGMEAYVVDARTGEAKHKGIVWEVTRNNGDLTFHVATRFEFGVGGKWVNDEYAQCIWIGPRAKKGRMMIPTPNPVFLTDPPPWPPEEVHYEGEARIDYGGMAKLA